MRLKRFSSEAASGKMHSAHDHLLVSPRGPADDPSPYPTGLQGVTTDVREQNWTAIAIEFVLVVAGVFLGIVAANWNEERLERRETQRLLEQVDEQLTANLGIVRPNALTGKEAQVEALHASPSPTRIALSLFQQLA